MIKVFSQVSYYIIAAVLFIIESIHIQKGDWGGDFWEHSATINELAKHPLHPNHPMLNIPVTHIFFSPYSLFVALVSKASGLTAFDSMVVFAYVNLSLLLCCFYFFCKALFKYNFGLIASLSLIFIFFFWGSNPFLWSGFYHIFVLNYILPYPSTFSLALSFLILGLLAKKSPQLNLYTCNVVCLTCIVFLSHPYTGVFLWVCIFVLVFTQYEVTFRQSCKYFSFMIIPFILICILWPYFSFTKLFVESNTEFHDISLQLYDRILGLNWPVIIAASGFFLVRRDNAYNFLIISLGCLILIYAISYLFSLFGLSRIISDVMIIGHILLAFTILRITQNKIQAKHLVYLCAVAILFGVSLYRNQPHLRRVFSFNQNLDISYYKRYEFLRQLIPADALVLSDEMSNWYIPTFSGKVISSAHPLFMVYDNDTRKKDVNSFFLQDTKLNERERIIQKYQPEYLLIDAKRIRLSNSTMMWIKSIAITLYDMDDLLLFHFSRKKGING